MIRLNSMLASVGGAVLLISAVPIVAQTAAGAPVSPAAPATNADGSTNARPLGAVANWVAMEDLPAAAMTAGNAHAVRVRLSVSPLGFVDGCTVLNSSGDAGVDSAVCAALQRNAFFTPAKNAAGQAVPGEFVRNVRWAPPAPETAPAAVPPAQ